MKKKVLLSAIFISAVFASSVIAFQPKSEDYEIVPDETTQVQQNIQPQMEPVEKVKTQKHAVQASDYEIMDSSQPVKQPENTLAVEVVSEIGQYLKIKQDGKYGVVDKSGNIILAPVFQSVDLVNQDGNEYFKAKADGKYRLYYVTGNLVSEKDIDSYTQNTSLLLARDLKPIFRSAVENKVVLYTKVEKEAPSDSLVYEIKEIPIVKVSNGQVVNMDKNIQNIINNVNNEQVAKSGDTADYFTVGKTQYKLIRENGKMGVSDVNGIQILPVKYDSIELKKPYSHFKSPVFLVSENNLYSVYDEKGIVLAEQVFDKINVYRKGKLYVYSFENGTGVLKSDGKEIGTFVPTEKGVYKFKPKNKFSIIKPHAVNSLIMTILNM